MENISEILWVILRWLSRYIENFPISVTDVECQVIPFWTGYNSSLSEYRPEWLSAFFEWCRENDILTALKDKLSPVLALPRFFRINYFLFKCFYDLLNPSSAPLEHQINVSKKDDCKCLIAHKILVIYGQQEVGN
jgi:hypothetical protein